MKKSLVFGVVIVLMMSFTFVLAKPDLVPATNNKAMGPVPVFIPAHAVQLADNVFSIGTGVDVDGRTVEGRIYVHPKRENAKPPWAGGGNGGGGNTKCYTLMSKGAKWKTTEGYITAPNVSISLTEASLESWDSEVGFEIFGPRNAAGVFDGYDDVAPDGKNEVEFLNLGPTNTIAFTVVWGIFSGPPGGRELVEWDAVFNSDYDWSESGEAGKMDYQNIATHEFGHSLGLTHPDSTCTDETMYAFAGLGETDKQNLNAGDIEGVNKLYA